MISYLYVLMSLRSSTKSINPRVCCFRYARLQIDKLDTQTPCCTRVDAHVANTILRSLIRPQHFFHITHARAPHPFFGFGIFSYAFGLGALFCFLLGLLLPSPL